MTHQDFKNHIWKFYREHGRHDLSWRKSITPYRIVVSEIMLQQTQVDRVIPYFKNWIKMFPNFQALAQAKQSDVLRAWKGLGYNSRALRLYKLAKLITSEYAGRLPEDQRMLESLPGIGPYTAGAIRAFAFNKPSTCIETNIRTVYLHHFFKNKNNVSDKEIIKKIEKHVPNNKVREWYFALMDYGAYLKKSGIRLNKKSTTYNKQKKFEGSDRQVRGQILSILLEQDRIGSPTLIKRLGEPKERLKKILQDLEQEGFIKQTRNTIILK